MALSDYYLCDVCESKTFYDANLDYEYDEKTKRNKLPRVGVICVLCEECAEKFNIVIVKKTQA